MHPCVADSKAALSHADPVATASSSPKPEGEADRDIGMTGA
jgi:hypothetical protein